MSLSFGSDKLEPPFYHFVGGERADAADVAEILRPSDHPTYGRAAGLYTRDLPRAIRVTKALQAGAVWVKRYGSS